MRIATRDRLWLLGGLIVAVLLAFITWQFLIKSQNDKTDSVKNDITTAQQQVTDSQRTLNQLKADNANLDKYKDALAAGQAALPSDAGIPAFLRELQTAGDQTGVGIAQLQVGAAGPVTGTPASASSSTAVQQITIQLVASGPTDNVTAFLKQLQAVQPRAILITSLTESPGSAGAGALTLNITFEVFVAPSAGTAAAATS